MNKALVVGSGAMYGAYGAGVIAELGRQLGPEYFSHVYASSVGVYSATLFVAGQPNELEKAWRYYVDGRKLINPFCFWNALKLDYLERIFQGECALFDVDALFQSGVSLVFVLTRLRDGKAVYQELTRENILECIKASCAMPFLYPAVQVDNELFFDGAFSDPLPVRKALEDGAKIVIAVTNKRDNFRIGRSFQVLGAACGILSKTVSRLVRYYETLVQETERILKDPRVIVIRPSIPLPLRSSIDTKLRRINATVNLGIEDAREALKHLRH